MASNGARQFALGRSYATRPASVWAMAAMTGAGGLMCLFAAAFPLSNGAPVELDALIGVGLLLECALVLYLGAALRSWTLHLLVVVATITISVLAGASATGQGVVVTAFGYL